MSQELILLPPIPDDIGKARCRVSNAVLEKRKIKAGQWVRLDSDNMSLFCRIWEANLPDNIIQADNLISQNVFSSISTYNHSCSLVHLKTPIQASIDVTLFIRFRYVNDDNNKEKKQFDDFGFVWDNGPETIKHLTIKSILSDMVICKGCSIFDERRCLEIVIHETNPSNSIQLFTNDTCIHITDDSFQNNVDDIDKISSLLRSTTLEEKIPNSVPGLHDAYEALYEVISYPLTYRDLIQKLNIECPKGILLYGPPGVGKTFLVNQISKTCGAKMITVNGPDIFGPFFGESERRLRNAFSQAKDLTIKENCPVILFIDELDALASRRTETQFHESRVIAQLLTLMDGMESRGRLVVIAATNRPNAIDPALRRPGRFDREIAVDVPSEQSRLEILKSQTFKMPLDDDVDLVKLASVTNGYVGADLASLCREAAMNAVHRQAELEKNELVNLVPKITMNDFTGAMLRVVPSLRRGYHVNVGKINWDDIGGLEDVKKKLRQAVEWPIKYRHTFERLGLKPPNGILLYGPPGCSKTTLAKVIASTSGATFLSINGAQLYSPYVGDSEQIIRTTFQRARSTSPSIIFFDEIDAIVGKRSFGSSGNNDSVQERILSMLLNEMDGIEVTTSVLVVGATNRPDMLDAALLRPGRFDKLIYVPPPDLSARKQILKICTSNMPLSDDIDLDLIAEQTELYTGADLKNLCRESAIISLRETGTASSVTMSNFYSGLNTVKPSLTANILLQYESLINTY
ncbi:AAA-domain-containing protein [Gigaspora margarita]|uniref:AAA-domain-containing protein n=1 Tax=Gigaspora margarita TaxID=4874 RepID=A0A8H3XNI1_GIGMA|nr:AAA-domain-containing protein [Gigaspora margarita]